MREPEAFLLTVGFSCFVQAYLNTSFVEEEATTFFRKCEFIIQPVEGNWMDDTQVMMMMLCFCNIASVLGLYFPYRRFLNQITSLCHRLRK